MTENEIIKEFEIFIKYGAPEELLNDVLNLINRKNAEIERLTVPKELIDDDFCGVVCEFAEELIKKAKAEAIKEFWGKLKEQNTMDARIVSVASGDNLLKEMTGGLNNG